MPNVLIADDELVILKVLQKVLEAPGRRVLVASSAEQTLRLAREHAPIDVALVDKNFGEASGLQVARDLKALDPGTEIILMTGYASLASAIEAVQIGAYDYLTKPIEDIGALRLKVSNAAEKVRLGRDHAAMTVRLAESEARYRNLFEAAPDAIVAFDPATERIELANSAAHALFGFSPEEMTQLAVAQLFAPPRPALVGGTLQGAAQAGVTCARRSGEAFTAEIRPGDLVLAGRTLRTLSVRDVSERERLESERRRAEDMLRHAQKMDALGRLAGGIGHDLGNMLAVVMNYVEDLAEKSDGQLKADLETVLTASQRGATLVRQMMSLSRMAPASPAVFAPNEAILAMVKLLRRAVGEAIEVVTDLAPDLGPIRMDHGHLGQVLLNLAVNARDAMPEGGRLYLKAEFYLLQDRKVYDIFQIPPGEYVRVSVSDTGKGMTPEVKKRIFEPFYTTKGVGKGTGLGMAMVYGIVKNHGGYINVYSEPELGTCVRIYLPKAEGPVEEKKGDRPEGAKVKKGTILVIDDEEVMRELSRDILEAFDFEVLLAIHGNEGVRIFNEHRDRIDLVVLDMIMPVKGGRQTFREIRSIRPDVKVLLCSGYAEEKYFHELLEAGNTGFLQKPFQNTELLGRIEELLSES